MSCFLKSAWFLYININVSHFFKKILKLIFLYRKNHDTFVTWRFYIQKFRHFQIGKSIFVSFFHIKTWNFALRNFPWDFRNWRRGEGRFLWTKTMHFALNYDIKQINVLSVSFLYTKSQTLCVTFLFAKNNALCVRFLYLRCIVYDIFIPNYKCMYDQSDHFDK